MRDSLDSALDDRQAQSSEPRGRAMGAPLSMGGRGRYVAAPAATRPAAVPPTAPVAAEASVAPASPQPDVDPLTGNLQKAISAFKVAVPLVQKLLPLLDGSVATMVSSVLAKKTPSPAPTPAPMRRPAQTAVVLHEPAPVVDLAPLEGSVNQLQMEQHELRGQIQEQNVSLKRMEDRLEMVREATDRNTLEQQELLDDLKSVGRRVNVVTLVLMAMLLVSVLLNLMLYLHVQRVLP